MKATRYIYSWHHWCGLVVGIFLLMMSVTGSMLVFSDELESLEEQQPPIVVPAIGPTSIDASFKLVQDKYLGWEIRLYHLPVKDQPLVYDLRKKEISKKVYVHPVTGSILSTSEDANNTIQRRLLLFHYTLSSGTIGKVIVFINGCLFLITLISGVIVYRKSLVKAFTFKIRLNKKTTRSYYSSLHRMIGVWSLIFNLMMVSTGLLLSGKIAMTALDTPAKTTSKKTSTNITSIDSAISLIAKDYPSYEIHQIRVKPAGNMINISGRFKDDPSIYGEYYSTFTIDGQTLQVKQSQFMKEMRVSDRIQKMAAPLHFGNYGGIALKIIYSLLGLTPAILSISGFVIWRKRPARRKPVIKQALS